VTPDARRPLAAAAAAFALLYFFLIRLPGGELWCDILLLVPPAIALTLLLRASRRPGRARWFWPLLALGPALWLGGEALWAFAEYEGRAPRFFGDRASGFPLGTDLFFIGFLVPMIGAVGLRPHPRPLRRDPAALADTALVIIALGYVFLRVVFLPLRGVEASSGSRSFVLGGLAFVLAAWTAGLGRRVEDPAWRRTYGVLCVFASLYGVLSAVANGMGRGMLPPGGAVDAGWFVPFFLLGAAPTKAAVAATRRVPSAAIVLMAATGPLVLDRILATILPSLGLAFEPQPILLLTTSALLALACAARLVVEERLEQEAQARARAFSEEARRAGRLSTLAALSAGLVEELERATEDVARHARSAAPLLGAKAEQVVEQAERARTIVRELAASFRLVPPGPRQAVDVGRVLEDTVAAVLDEGLPLRVSLEGTGHLPEVTGDAGALGAAILNVVRNAAQASPGGVLRISASTDGREVVLRFGDDGPGVSADIRDRVFDPFFTTRRAGEGVGLGLTQAHFVARAHLGSVVLEPSDEGACFVFRLPARERRAAMPVPDAWPLSGAALLSAAVATLLVLLPPGAGRAWWGLSLQAGAAVLAAGALVGAGLSHRGRARWFWWLLGAGPGLWALTRILPMLERGAEGAPGTGVGHSVLNAAAELVWVAALLQRPDRKHDARSPARALLGAGAVLCLFAYFYTYLVVLPWPFAEGDSGLHTQVALVRGLQRAALAVWAFLLARGAASVYWRVALGRLALVFTAWAVGQTAAGYAGAGYRGGSLADLGWIVPYLLLAAVALAEGRRLSRPEPHFASTARAPFGAAAALAVVAAAPLFDFVVGSSGHPALDAARDDLTTLTVVVLAMMLMLRELLAEREGAATPASAPSASSDSLPRLPGLVASAVYELGGHLSGIADLARLVLTQSDLPPRVREDAQRIRGRGDSGLRIVNNVITALRGTSSLPELVSVNLMVRQVIAERSSELAEESISMRASLADAVPLLSLSVTALRQAVLCCVDAVAAELRATGRGGMLEIVTAVEEHEVGVSVRNDEGALPPSALRQLGPAPGGLRPASGELEASLGLAREIVFQLRGTLTGRNRPQGGVELWIRLPLPAASGAAFDRGSAARSGPG
jgi:signal transduction histidine kinase